MKPKKLKQGYVKVDMTDLDCISFSDMSFFDQWIPEGCKLVQVQFYHEPGYWDEDPEINYISIEWKEKE